MGMGDTQECRPFLADGAIAERGALGRAADDSNVEGADVERFGHEVSLAQIAVPPPHPDPLPRSGGEGVRGPFFFSLSRFSGRGSG